MSCSKCESKRCITFKESIYNLVVRVGVLWNIRVLCLWTVDWFFSYWYFNLDTCLIIYFRNEFCFFFHFECKISSKHSSIVFFILELLSVLHHWYFALTEIVITTLSIYSFFVCLYLNIFFNQIALLLYAFSIYNIINYSFILQVFSKTDLWIWYTHNKIFVKITDGVWKLSNTNQDWELSNHAKNVVRLTYSSQITPRVQKFSILVGIRRFSNVISHFDSDFIVCGHLICGFENLIVKWFNSQG